MIEEYIEMAEDIKREAIRINNMLPDIDTDGVFIEWCGVSTEYLELDVCFVAVRLRYEEPYEDYCRNWVIPSECFGMTDDEIKNIFLKKLKRRDDSITEAKRLEVERLASELGYKLIKE